MRVYLALLLCCWSISASAREISGCGHPEYPPVSWVDNTTLVGVAPSVARHLFAELGYTLTLDTSGNWERCLQEVKAGNIDVVLAAYRTEARSEFLHYLDNYLVADPLSIFIRTADESEYRSLQDLSGKRVGLLLGDSFGDAVDQFLKQHTRREFVSKGAQNFAKLAYSRIDLMPLGISSGQLQLEKFGYGERIKRSALTIGVEYYYLALSKKSALTLPLQQLDAQIATLRARGVIGRLQRCFSRYYLTANQEAACDGQF